MDFGLNLEAECRTMLEEYVGETWQPAEYAFKEVWKPKHRMVAMLPVRDHVMVRAVTDPIEPSLVAAMYPGSYSCVKGRGTHAFLRALRRELWVYPADETRYEVQLDVHHCFPSINHELMKVLVHQKVKDRRALCVIDRYIDSYHEGLPLGIKASQMLNNLYLTPFDWSAKECFRIGHDPERLAYWRSRYVSDKLLTCRNEADASELAGGVTALSARFDRYVREGMKHYLRFADNIVMLHGDKTFLHLMVELAQMVMTRDFLLTFNRRYNVRPVDAGGIDVCGYVFFHGYTRLRKRNKQGLCRQVAQLRQKGVDEKTVRKKCSGRVGFAGHADTKHLLNVLGMERLGRVIKNKRAKAPFEGMTVEQKESIESLVCHDGSSEAEKLILLTDYKIDESVLERKEGEEPRLRIALRYRHAKAGSADEWEDAEHYAYSGSQIMIDQARRDFSPGDLPAATVIREESARKGGRYYKFT